MEIQISQILKKYSKLVELHSGSTDRSFRRVQDPNHATATDMVFVTDLKYLDQALNSSAAVVVVGQGLREVLPQTKKTLLISPNAQLLMARILRDFLPTSARVSEFEGHRIHPTAVIAKSATIDMTAKIGPFVIIGENVFIGARTVVDGHCVIRSGARLGQDCYLHPSVFVGHDCEIGDGVEIQPQTTIGTEGFGYAHDEHGHHERIPHCGRVIIEKNVDIGAGVHMDRGTFRDTRIGEGTKIDNLCHFAHNVQIGRYCLIAAGFMTAGSTTVGNHVVIGGRVNLTGHIHIADGVQIAGMSTVGKSITEKGAYQGYPVQPLFQHKRTVAALLTLPQMRKDVLRILKFLNLSE